MSQVIVLWIHLNQFPLIIHQLQIQVIHLQIFFIIALHQTNINRIKSKLSLEIDYENEFKESENF